LLPIPLLDGGHLLFMGYEAIFQSQPSLRAKIWAFRISSFVLVSLVVFVILNDIVRLVGGR